MGKSSFTCGVEDLANYLRGFDFRYANEDQLQGAIEAALRDRGHYVQPEYRLGDHGRVDFYVAGVGIEVKVAGAAADVRRQLVRYAKHPDIHALILVTNRARHSFGDDIEGVPLHVVSLIRRGL